MVFLSSRWSWLVLALLFLAVVLFKRKKGMLHFALSMALTIGVVDGVTYQVLKPLVARERPCHQLQEVRLVPQWCGGDFGFPSNHAANGMAATVVVYRWLGRKAGVVALMCTLIVGLSRIYLGVHFPGDVLAGYVVGGCMGFLCDYLPKILSRRVAAHKAPSA